MRPSLPMCLAHRLRRAATAACLALCLPAVAAAETARVRSGDHPDRTRLVIELAAPSAWRLGRIEGGYAIELARAEVDFDLSGVFRLITRARIATVEPSPAAARLTLRIACDCHATAFDFGANRIVIDVVDGPAAGNAPFEKPFAHQDGTADAGGAPDAGTEGAFPLPAGLLPWVGSGGTPARAGVTVPDLEPLSGPQSRRAPLPRPAIPALSVDPRAKPDPSLAGPTPGQLAAHAAAAMGAIAPAADPTPGPGDERIAAQEAALLEELARAAAQGLLEAHLPALDRVRDQDVAAAPVPPPPPEPPEPPGPEDHFRLRAETSIDRDSGASSPGRGVTDAGIACLPDSALDLAAWGGAEDPAEGITLRRAKLVGEFDRPDAAAVLALARYYLHLGFGAEARATLAAFGGDRPNEAVLLALAGIVDGSGEGLPGPLAGQQSCDGAVALWSTLAEADAGGDPAPNVRALVAAFSALPLHLRRMLGPGLAERFLRAGDEDTALRLRNAITRAPGDHGGGMALFDARLALHEGDPAAPEALARLLGSDEATAAAAYRTYLETELAAGRLPPDAAETAAALAFEMDGTEAGAALAELSARSLLAEGRFDEARAEIARLAGADSGAGARLWPQFARNLALRAPDGVLLAQYFAAREAVTAATIGPGAALTLAPRLTALGFGEEALRVLPDAGDEAPLRLARAEALIAAGAHARAISELAALGDAQADALRARALFALGDARAAAERYAAAGNQGAAEHAAWLAGAWEGLAGSADPAIRAMAEARLAGQTAAAAAPTPAPPGGVEAARGAVARASTARASVEGLLARSP